MVFLPLLFLRFLPLSHLLLLHLLTQQPRLLPDLPPWTFLSTLSVLLLPTLGPDECKGKLLEWTGSPSRSHCEGVVEQKGDDGNYHLLLGI